MSRHCSTKQISLGISKVKKHIIFAIHILTKMENKKECYHYLSLNHFPKMKIVPAKQSICDQVSQMKKKRTPVCIYLNALNIPIKYSYTCTVLSNIICSSHERDASITILCYISFLTFNLIVNYVHVSLFLFAALKRTTRGFDAKGNCSARTYEYLTPTFAFAKDYVRHTCCLRKS